MRRRLFNIISGMSLVLCVATCVIWARSNRASDTFTWTSSTQQTSYALDWARGEIDLEYATPDPDAIVGSVDDLPPPGFAHHRTRPDANDTWTFFPPQKDLHVLGARYRSGKASDFDAYEVSIPVWMICIALGVMPLLGFRSWSLRRSRRTHLCLSCGYDLRATPDRCPECGAVPASRPQPQVPS